MAAAPWLKDKKADSGRLAAVLGKLRGAALRLAVGKDCQGQLQVDFDADVAPLGDFAKPMVLQALGNLGLQTDEISKWEVSYGRDRSACMASVDRLPTAGVMSVIELPAAEY